MIKRFLSLSPKKRVASCFLVLMLLLVAAACPAGFWIGLVILGLIIGTSVSIAILLEE